MATFMTEKQLSGGRRHTIIWAESGGAGAWEGPMGQTLRSQEGPKAGLVSEVLSEWVSGWAPFSSCL